MPGPNTEPPFFEDRITAIDYLYTRGAESIPDTLKDDCPICREPYRSSTSNLPDNETAVMAPCGHVFGGRCISLWLEDNPTCPTCRRELYVPPKTTENRAFENPLTTLLEAAVQARPEWDQGPGLVTNRGLPPLQIHIPRREENTPQVDDSISPTTYALREWRAMNERWGLIEDATSADPALEPQEDAAARDRQNTSLALQETGNSLREAGLTLEEVGPHSTGYWTESSGHTTRSGGP
ncbi:hypothetical protein M011DRAFT_457358 [Sporormia fimetaria CBS 119925]|uniref:RING-type domain-containing protein n=1 Tax=Sporormia fimetaria CBS 119925 TaxID=1340428 RepID=A0A6A6VDD0_9PLEO|nr:hypothetical protein M011DRAFT_457358 [Sporormia fimetaria CBS 119925]